MTTLLHDGLSAAPAARNDAPATLLVERWADPIVDEVGHDPRSLYVEQYWLPVLGPSTTWMLRRFAAYLDDYPDGFEVEVEEFARGLGLGERFGPNAPFAKTLKRCVDFQMAEWRGTAFAVRRRLPPLARRHLRRLPDGLAEQHERELQEMLRAAPVHERLRAQGRELALSLVAYGDDRAGAEQQLIRCGFEPVVAAECAGWAVVEVRARRQAPAGT